MIAGAGRLRRQQLADAIESLHAIDAHVLGVVINRMPTKGRNSYGYSYYGTYQPRPADIAAAVAAGPRPTAQPPIIGLPPQRFLPPPAASGVPAQTSGVTTVGAGHANGVATGSGGGQVPTAGPGPNGRTPATSAQSSTGAAPNGNPTTGQRPEDATAGRATGVAAEQVLPPNLGPRHRR